MPKSPMVHYSDKPQGNALCKRDANKVTTDICRVQCRMCLEAFHEIKTPDTEVRTGRIEFIDQELSRDNVTNREHAI